MWPAERLICVFVLAAIGLASCGSNDSFTSTVVDGARSRVIEYRVWAPDQPRPAPLVLISHGSGGHYSDHVWLVESFRRAGFIVAALNHPHDSRRDRSREGLVRVWDRPPDVSLLLSHLLGDAEWRKRIDSRRVAVVGFSSGGYTAIALAGGIFDPTGMDRYCASPAGGADCEAGRGVTVDRTNATRSVQDDRIVAAVAMAPAVGPGVTEDSLKGIEIPVFLVAAADDELVKPDLGAQRYAGLIPRSRLTMLPAGGHFVFLECLPATAIVDLFMDYNLCGWGIDADRTQIHGHVSDAIVRFLVDSFAARDSAT
jgi:predicted dienelactone hydrolase